LEAPMNRRDFALPAAFAMAAVILLMAPTGASGQDAGAAPRTARGWQVPRLPDGRPDLQGFWTNDTFTPLERPADLAGKELFTEEEAAAYLKKRLDQYLAQPKDDIHYDDEIWQGERYSKEPNLRTSLIVDPRDGKVPPLSPEGERAAAARAGAKQATGPADSAQARSLAERCISWGTVGPPMLPPTYNANLQILQTRDYVVIRHEMIHEDRIIPLDGRPHAGTNVRQLAGDSRGHWEGDTLVIDTTNFTDKTNFRGAPRNTRQDILASRSLHVVERLTRVSADRIRYQFTVDDPNTWTRPWSAEIPMIATKGPLFEYACHEGNYGMPDILKGARFTEKEAAPGAARDPRR
jgi:hypothetical protein